MAAHGHAWEKGGKRKSGRASVDSLVVEIRRSICLCMYSYVVCMSSNHVMHGRPDTNRVWLPILLNMVS